MMPQRDATKRPIGARAVPRALSAVRRLCRPLAAFARRFGLAVAFVLAGSLGGFGYCLITPKTYTATAYVLVVDEDGQSGPAAISFAQAYGRLAPLPETLSSSSIPLPEVPAASIREHIQAATSPDTPLIRLTGGAATPADAATYANAAADALLRYGTAHRADTRVHVALMSLASTPATPSSPNLALDVAVGTASGVLLAGLSAAIISGRRGRGAGAVAHPRPVTGPATGAAVGPPADDTPSPPDAGQKATSTANPAAKNAAKDAAKDAAKNAGKSSGRGSGRSAGKGAEKSAGKGSGKSPAKGPARGTARGTAATESAGAPADPGDLPAGRPVPEPAPAADPVEVVS